MVFHYSKWLIIAVALVSVSCSQAVPTSSSSITQPVILSTPVPSATANLLETSESVEFSLWVLADDYSNCNLPCWWGVVPGETSENEFNQEWSRIFSASSFSRPGLVIVETVEGDTFIAARVYYEFSANQLEWMNVETYAAQEIQGGYKHLFGEEAYIQFIDGYGLDDVLMDFGLPEVVKFYLTIGIAEPNAPNAFGVLLSYPERGVIFHYTAEPVKEEAQPIVCLHDLFFNAWLFPLGDAEGVRDKMNEFMGPYTLDVEQVYGLTVDEFHDKFRNGGDECLTIPVDAWPEP